MQSSISSSEVIAALSNVTLNDGETDTLQSSRALKCPYEPGARLSLYHEDGRQLDAIITKTFTGGADHHFSNSCTVQIHVVSSHRDLAFDTSQEMVLKIMDWRYSGTVRSWFHGGPWNVQRRNELSTWPQNEKRQFESWLCDSMHDSIRTNEYVEQLCARRVFPPKPTNNDFYANAMRNPYLAREFSSQKLIPYPITGAHREVFLQRRADLQLAREVSVAETVQRYLPGFMPQVFGKVRVHLVSDGESQVELPEIVENPVYGLLMEQIRGEPMVTFQNANLDDAIVKQLVSRMMLFNLQLWRCNLDLSDGNLHNFILEYGSQTGTYQIKIVDHGGLMIVAPDAENPGYVKIDLHGTSRCVQLHQECYYDFFDVDGEAPIITSIASRLTSPKSTLHTQRKDVLLECFDTIVVDAGYDLLVWHAVMLHILYAFDRATVHKNADTVIKIVHDARRIMTEEHSRQSSEPWSRRAVTRLARTMGNEVQSAQQEMKKLGDALGQRGGSWGRLDSLTILNVVDGRSRGKLLFPDAEAMLQNYRDRKDPE